MAIRYPLFTPQERRSMIAFAIIMATVAGICAMIELRRASPPPAPLSQPTQTAAAAPQKPDTIASRQTQKRKSRKAPKQKSNPSEEIDALGREISSPND